MLNKKVIVVFAISTIVVFVVLGFIFSRNGKGVNNIFSEVSKIKLSVRKNAELVPSVKPVVEQEIQTIWYTDFSGKRVVGLDITGNQVWLQHMDAPPIPPRGYATHTEYVTVAPNGNLIVSDGEAMFVQEIDRKTHELVWQYGVKDIQGYVKGYLHQPDKSFKINDHEVLINDGNNRRVIIVDQLTNDVVWQYGETLRMGKTPGMLMAGTNTVPLDGGKQIIITDTLEKKVMIVDRATKNIVWEWTKPDAGWIQHVWPTKDGTFVMEDRNKNEVFEVNKEGKILWTLNRLEDGSSLKHPTDVVKLANGNVLIAESGRGRIIEVNPITTKLIKEYSKLGLVTTVAVDNRGL